MAEPLVSIGFPVLNGGQLLRRALKSVADQSYPNLEVIVSDNASDDTTAEVCAELRGEYGDRLRIHRQPVRLPVMDNFRFVLEQARGSFFMWAAHDDFWYPDFVKRLLGQLDVRPDCGVAMSAVRRVFSDGAEQDTVRFVGPLSVTQGWYRLAANIAGGMPLHLFIYGLYRTPFLREVFRHFPNVASSDRLFIMRVALSTGLAYVDDVLLERTTQRDGHHKRYAHEALGRNWQDPLRGYRTVGAMLPYMLRARTIPARRKIALPLLLGKLAATYLGSPRNQLSMFAQALRTYQARSQQGPRP